MRLWRTRREHAKFVLEVAGGVVAVGAGLSFFGHTFAWVGLVLILLGFVGIVTAVVFAFGPRQPQGAGMPSEPEVPSQAEVPPMRIGIDALDSTIILRGRSTIKNQDRSIRSERSDVELHDDSAIE